MKQFKFGLVALAAALLVSGCGVGIIYTHTYQPLSLDMHNTKVVPTGADGNIKHIQVGMAGVAWDSAAIGDIAKKNGLTEIYSADLETFKVLGIWNQYTVHVYGK
jgi:hypothetical protein